MEKTFVTINGTKMGMFIQGKDKPVLLVLHGGPGMPEYFLEERYKSGLMQKFVVVWWEQRGSGITYDPHLDTKTLTVEQAIDDTIKVTEYLIKRFSQKKIYLLGHSFGTFIGIQAVKRRPELYHAYLGVAQITYQKESERLAYDYMMNYFIKKGNKRVVKDLKSINYQSKGYGKIRDRVMHQAGIGTMHQMHSIIKGVFFESFRCNSYRFREKIAIWKGRILLKHSELEQTKLSSKTDLRSQITSLEVPTYFFSGQYDYTVNYKMARAYLDKLAAPKKQFFLFKHSAHSPMFEEPNEFIEQIEEHVLCNQENS